MKKAFFRIILYLLLAAGATTMVFPFVWMLSTSMKSSLEVLSSQITIIPRLKKYIRIEGRLEEVEFRLALKLEREVSLAEGRISLLCPGGEDPSRGAVAGIFQDYYQELQQLFRRLPAREELAGKLNSLWIEGPGKILKLPAIQKLDPDKLRRLAEELAGLKTSLDRLSGGAVLSPDRLAVVVLAGENRGKEFEIHPDDLIWKRFLWENFKAAWQSAPFGRYFINSIIMSVAVTLGQVLTSALAAYAFARMKFRFKETLFMILLATMMIPKQVILIPDYAILSKLHWINTYYVLIIPFIAAVFGIYFLRQHFETLPQDLFDAANIDGCGRLRTLFQIVLPISRGVLITVALFTFIMTWNSLLWPLVMTNTPEMRPLQVGLAVFNQESGTDWQLLMAASTFAVFPLLIIFFLAQKQFIEGIARSGMKE